MKTADDRFCNEVVKACPHRHAETARTTTCAAASQRHHRQSDMELQCKRVN